MEGRLLPGGSARPEGSAAHVYAARWYGPAGLSALALCSLLAHPTQGILLGAGAALAGVWRATRAGPDRASDGSRGLALAWGVVTPLFAAGQGAWWQWGSLDLLRYTLRHHGPTIDALWAALGVATALALGRHLVALSEPGSSLRRNARWLVTATWAAPLVHGLSTFALHDLSQRSGLYGLANALWVASLVGLLVLPLLGIALCWFFEPLRGLELLLPAELTVERAAPEGLTARGEVRGQEVMVRLAVVYPTPGAEIVVVAPGLGERWPALRLRRRAQGEVGGDMPDPLLRGLLFAEGIAPEAAAALLAGLQAEALGVLHAWPGSTVEGGAVRLRVETLGAEAPDPDFLRERVAEAVALAAALAERVSRLESGLIPEPSLRVSLETPA